MRSLTSNTRTVGGGALGGLGSWRHSFALVFTGKVSRFMNKASAFDPGTNRKA